MPSIQAAVRFILANRAYQIFRDVSLDMMKLSLHQAFKERMGQWLGKIPMAVRIFTANVLRPWSAFRAQNLVFLRKASNDQLDWRFHPRF
jgi:hypothetical protein